MLNSMLTRMIDCLVFAGTVTFLVLTPSWQQVALMLFIYSVYGASLFIRYKQTTAESSAGKDLEEMEKRIRELELSSNMARLR